MIPLIIQTTNLSKAEQFLKSEGLLDQLVYQIDHLEKIGVDEVRQLLRQSTYQSLKLQTYLINKAENLTLPSQHLLLKSLEEAKYQQLFVLITSNYHSLLPTILSRCQLIKLGSNSHDDLSPESLKIIRTLSLNIADCIKVSDEISKSDPQGLIVQLIKELRWGNLSSPTLKKTQVLKFALQCLDDLKSNLNTKLALDRFLLKSNQLIKMNPANDSE